MSKAEIIAAIQKNKPPLVPLPAMVDYGITYADTLSQFKESLTSIHALLETYSSVDNFRQTFTKTDQANNAVYWQMDHQANETINMPHDYAHLTHAIYQGCVAVAENGAIFIDFTNEAHRSPFVLAQNLYIIIDQKHIVDNMHQAYGKINHQCSYGVFVSGPSKTADIQQSLVIGAHGVRSLTVILIDN